MKKTFFTIIILLPVIAFSQRDLKWKDTTRLHVEKLRSIAFDEAGSADTSRLAAFTNRGFIVPYTGSIGTTYTANLPVRITTTVISLDTSNAYASSVTTNLRLLKVADSIKAATIAAVKALTKSKGFFLETPGSAEAVD